MADSLRNQFPAKKMLYLCCSVCEHHLRWEIVPRTRSLRVYCCGSVMLAEPLFNESRFHVRIFEADMTNVRPMRF